MRDVVYELLPGFTVTSAWFPAVRLRPGAPTCLTELLRDWRKRGQDPLGFEGSLGVSINFDTAHVNPSRNLMHIRPIGGGVELAQDERLLGSGIPKVGASVFSYVQLISTRRFTVVEAISKQLFEPKRLSSSSPSTIMTRSKDPKGPISATNC